MKIIENNNNPDFFVLPSLSCSIFISWKTVISLGISAAKLTPSNSTHLQLQAQILKSCSKTGKAVLC